MRASVVVVPLVIIALVVGIRLQSIASTINMNLSAAMELIPKLREEISRDDVQAADITVAELSAHTKKAREAASDPVWVAAGALPWLGSSFQAVGEVAVSADDVAQFAAVPLVAVFGTLDWSSLAPNDAGVDLEPLTDVQPKIVSAANAVEHSADRLDNIESEGLLQQVLEPLSNAQVQLRSLRTGLRTAADVAIIAPTMMGGTTPRNYLLLVQNNAEVRASGGIPGAVAVLQLDHGKLSLHGQNSATALGIMSPVVPVDLEQKEIYSARLGKFMQDVNLTPDFPTSASIALAMWKQKMGTQLDGVISVDPVALSYILDATGPINLANSAVARLKTGNLPNVLDAKNVVPTLLSNVYEQIPEPAMQDAYFASLAKEVFSAVSAKGNSAELIASLTRATAEGRILVWSGATDEQSVIANYQISGSIAGPSISPAQFGTYFNDGTGAKMDYYVKRTVQLIKECPRDGYHQVKVRVTSTNTAPADAGTSLPSYVTGAGAFGVPAGTVRTNITAYGPVQSQVESAVADGKKIGFASQIHSGRPVGTVTVELPPGKSSTVEFTFGKIVQHTEPKLSVTPTVQAVKDVVLNTISEKCTPVP